jgi:hypothetical protein
MRSHCKRFCLLSRPRLPGRPAFPQFRFAPAPRPVIRRLPVILLAKTVSTPVSPAVAAPFLFAPGRQAPLFTRQPWCKSWRPRLPRGRTWPRALATRTAPARHRSGFLKEHDLFGNRFPLFRIMLEPAIAEADGFFAVTADIQYGANP